MLRSLKNIARCTVVGFLLLSVSGLTIAVEHEHAIEKSPDLLAVHPNSNPEGTGIESTPLTYHETHFLKLLSGDSFDGSQKMESKTSPVKFFAVHLVFLELSPVYHSISLANIDIKETGPPSGDRYILNCSLLI